MSLEIDWVSQVNPERDDNWVMAGESHPWIPEIAVDQRDE